MKKTTKKLTLTRESLRVLEKATAGQGIPDTREVTERIPSFQTYCDLTMGC